MAEDGAIVVVNYNQSDEKAKQVVTGIQAKGGKAVAIQSDMSQVADARRLVIETVEQFGRLDILVNNAGRFMPKALLDITEANFDQIIALNAKGPYFAMQEAANVLMKRLGLPKDIADVVAFVVSEEARWLTGQNIHAGGGIVM